MNEDFILITGANGEVGHGLIKHLAKVGHKKIIAFSRRPLSDELHPFVSHPGNGRSGSGWTYRTLRKSQYHHCLPSCFNPFHQSRT